MITEIKAKLNKLDIAPRKTRSVAKIIAGLPIGEAEAQLLFRKERAVRPILKLLRSAVANIKNKGLTIDGFYVKTIYVNKGQVMKRWLPRARGMATPLHKTLSHVTIVLAKSENKKSRFIISDSNKTKKSDKKSIKDKKDTNKLLSKNKELVSEVKNIKDKEIKIDKSKSSKADNSIKRMFRRKSV